MKKTFQILVACTICTSLYVGCQTTNSNDDVSISGTVIDSQSGTPIQEAIVEITSPEEISGTAKVTDENGLFKFDLTVSESPTLLILVRKSGYEDGSINVPVSGGLDIQLDQPIRLTINDTTVIGPSEPAARILLESVEQTILNITGTGGVDNSKLIFQVQDSSGNNLDLSNSIDVNFSIISGPDGGEGVLPEKVKTNANGIAETTLYSGNKAGVTQILAEIIREDVDLTIQSTPVAITIHGGYPSQSGFYVTTDQQNLESSNTQESIIIAKMVDKFSNPVKPGTAVYFSTTIGSIQGSNAKQSDENGEAEVKFWCDGNLGSGIITAQTVDENNVKITKDLPVVCSSSNAIISVTPSTFTINNGESKRFDFTVTDNDGLPMARGTSVKVLDTENNNYTIEGNTNLVIPDAIKTGSGITNFSFVLQYFGIDGGDLIIPIEITSPSGQRTIYNLNGNSTDNNIVAPVYGAASIILTRVTEEVINIQGTGGKVNSEFTFEVQDSTGRKLDLDNQTEVNFSILVGPDGGERLLPESAMTNSEGLVTTSLFSGSKAGVVQVQAEIVRDDLTPPLTIRSTPIAVTIHGGFPDKNNFSLAPEKYNFEGYTINGNTNKITAIIGDEFSNPVKPGTAVYFSSTGGIIEGSGVGNTNSQGFVTVELISGGQRPADTETIDGTPFTKNGLGTVTASTVDKDNNLISKSINLVFSTSAAIISTDSTTFDLDPNGGETFDYTVTDLNGNPMAAGTTIVVDAGNLEVSGDGNITLGNHIFSGPGATEFTFSIRDTDTGSNDPAPLSIKITVTSPNGNVTSLTPITGTRRLF